MCDPLGWHIVDSERASCMPDCCTDISSNVSIKNMQFCSFTLLYMSFCTETYKQLNSDLNTYVPCCCYGGSGGACMPLCLELESKAKTTGYKVYASSVAGCNKAGVQEQYCPHPNTSEQQGVQGSKCVGYGVACHVKVILCATAPLCALGKLYAVTCYRYAGSGGYCIGCSFQGCRRVLADLANFQHITNSHTAYK
jgi:hypothetical protein